MGTAWAIVAVVVPAIIGLGTTLMTNPSMAAHIVASIMFLLSGGALLVTATIWWLRYPKKDWTVHMRAIGLLTLVCIGTPTMLWFTWAANAQNGAAPPMIQQNNQGAPNVNIPGTNNHLYFNSPQQPTPQRTPSRSSSAIYQDGERHGNIEGPKPDLVAGTVFIQRLNFDSDFIPGNEFEQGDFKLLIIGRDGSEAKISGPQGTAFSWFNVVCKIVSRI
jgi:hypothetical protein